MFPLNPRQQLQDNERILKRRREDDEQKARNAEREYDRVGRERAAELTRLTLPVSLTAINESAGLQREYEVTKIRIVGAHAVITDAAGREEVFDCRRWAFVPRVGKRGE